MKPSSWHHTKYDKCLLTHPCALDFAWNTGLQQAAKCSWSLCSVESYKIGHFVDQTLSNITKFFVSDLSTGEAQKCVCQGVGNSQLKRPMAGYCDKLKEAECGELWESQGKEGPEPGYHSWLPIGNETG